jgi:hypothetical protein
VAFYFLKLLLIVYCGCNLQIIDQAMDYRSVKGFSGWGQLGMLLVFLGAGFVLAGGAQLVIGMQLIPAGLSFEQMADAMVKANAS